MPRNQPPQPPANLRGYRPMPLALIDAMSVCEKCWAFVLRFHQENHDQWHAALAALHTTGGN